MKVLTSWENTIKNSVMLSLVLGASFAASAVGRAIRATTVEIWDDGNHRPSATEVLAGIFDAMRNEVVPADFRSTT